MKCSLRNSEIMMLEWSFCCDQGWNARLYRMKTRRTNPLFYTKTWVLLISVFVLWEWMQESPLSSLGTLLSAEQTFSACLGCPDRAKEHRTRREVFCWSGHGADVHSLCSGHTDQLRSQTKSTVGWRHVLITLLRSKPKGFMLLMSQ